MTSTRRRLASLEKFTDEDLKHLACTDLALYSKPSDHQLSSAAAEELGVESPPVDAKGDKSSRVFGKVGGVGGWDIAASAGWMGAGLGVPAAGLGGYAAGGALLGGLDSYEGSPGVSSGLTPRCAPPFYSFRLSETDLTKHPRWVLESIRRLDCTSSVRAFRTWMEETLLRLQCELRERVPGSPELLAAADGGLQEMEALRSYLNLYQDPKENGVGALREACFKACRNRWGSPVPRDLKGLAAEAIPLIEFLASVEPDPHMEIRVGFAVGAGAVAELPEKPMKPEEMWRVTESIRLFAKLFEGWEGLESPLDFDFHAEISYPALFPLFTGNAQWKHTPLDGYVAFSKPPKHPGMEFIRNFSNEGRSPFGRGSAAHLPHPALLSSISWRRRWSHALPEDHEAGRCYPGYPLYPTLIHLLSLRSSESDIISEELPLTMEEFLGLFDVATGLAKDEELQRLKQIHSIAGSAWDVRHDMGGRMGRGTVTGVMAAAEAAVLAHPQEVLGGPEGLAAFTASFCAKHASIARDAAELLPPESSHRLACLMLAAGFTEFSESVGAADEALKKFSNHAPADASFMD